MELRAPTATLTLLGDRHTHALYGVFGGHPGKRAETLLVRDGGTESFGSKEVVELRGGDVVSFRLAGAGGHGRARRSESTLPQRRTAFSVWLSDAPLGSPQRVLC